MLLLLLLLLLPLLSLYQLIHSPRHDRVARILSSSTTNDARCVRSPARRKRFILLAFAFFDEIDGRPFSSKEKNARRRLSFLRLFFTRASGKTRVFDKALSRGYGNQGGEREGERERAPKQALLERQMEEKMKRTKTLTKKNSFFFYKKTRGDHVRPPPRPSSLPPRGRKKAKKRPK